MTEYFWCLVHDRVEERGMCTADDRLGPYETPEAARGWRDRHELRDEAWQTEDERWESTLGDGDDED